MATTKKTQLPKLKFKTPTKIEVRHSPGKGRGVFATKAIRAKEVIEVAPSLLVPPECAFLPTLLKLGFTSARTLRRQHLGIGVLPGLRGRLCAQASFGEG